MEGLGIGMALNFSIAALETEENAFRIFWENDLNLEFSMQTTTVSQGSRNKDTQRSIQFQKM